MARITSNFNYFHKLLYFSIIVGQGERGFNIAKTLNKSFNYLLRNIQINVMCPRNQTNHLEIKLSQQAITARLPSCLSVQFENTIFNNIIVVVVVILNKQ